MYPRTRTWLPRINPRFLPSPTPSSVTFQLARTSLRKRFGWRGPNGTVCETPANSVHGSAGSLVIWPNNGAGNRKKWLRRQPAIWHSNQRRQDSIPSSNRSPMKNNGLFGARWNKFPNNIAKCWRSTIARDNRSPRSLLHLIFPKTPPDNDSAEVARCCVAGCPS